MSDFIRQGYAHKFPMTEDDTIPLLIGRSYLAGEFLIDSAETFTLKPRCRKEKRN